MRLLNALSILLVIITPLAYLPQYRRLLTHHSTHGISIWATFLIVLVYQAEIANMYYLFQNAPKKSVPESRFGVPINTPSNLRDWINFAQILMQWGCALLLFGIVCYLPLHPPNESEDPMPPDQDNRSSTKKTTLILLTIHASLFALAVYISPRPYEEMDISFNVTCSMTFFVVNPLLLLALLLSFLLQARVTLDDGTESLSKQTVLLQGIVFAGLAVTWPFRLILPQNMWEVRPVDPVVLTTWYPWVGWACVNSAVVANGSAILLFIASKSDVQPGSTAERRVLLAA